jgi:uncharacterized membrane protein (GlpM family)
MDLSRYAIYFVTGGLITTAIVGFEESGFTLISRIAALFPVFTWLAYLFIGASGTAQQVSAHAKFVLIGTIFSWIPYMLTIIYLSPKIGVNKAVLISIAVFLVVSSIFTYIYLRI